MRTRLLAILRALLIAFTLVNLAVLLYPTAESIVWGDGPGFGKSRVTRNQAQHIVRSIDEFQADHGRCPHGERELIEAGALRSWFRDGWGHPYDIQCSPERIAVCSFGVYSNDAHDDVCELRRPSSAP